MTDDRQARALRDALRRMIVAHGALDEARRPCGARLSAPHAWALLELRDGCSMTVTELAERLQVDRTNVSRLVARMASLGEIERVPHPGDGRARPVRLTGRGTRLAQAVDRSSAEHFAGLLGRLGRGASEVVGALEALTRAMTKTPSKESCA